MSDDMRVWIGCLGCYNEGRLVGEWTPAEDAESVTVEYLHDTQLSASDRIQGHGHEELWVMDHEGFGGLLTGECSPAEAQRLAELVDDLTDDERTAFGYYVENMHSGPVGDDTVTAFRDAYLGCYESFESWAWQYLEDTGMLAELPAWARVHEGDLASAWARDARIGGDVTAVEVGYHEVYVFDNH